MPSAGMVGCALGVTWGFPRRQSTGGVGTGGASSSLPTFPAAISRSAITVGLSLLGSTSGVAPSAICRARLVAASVSSKRFEKCLMQSSTVMRAMVSLRYLNSSSREARRIACCARDRNQVRQCRLEALIDNYIFKFKNMRDFFAGAREAPLDRLGRVLSARLQALAKLGER